MEYLFTYTVFFRKTDSIKPKNSACFRIMIVSRRYNCCNFVKNISKRIVDPDRIIIRCVKFTLINIPMKRILYTVIVLLVFTNIMVAQLGVGTEAPNTSSQLEVVSADRGILIPRIELESTTDQSTIRNGNVNSLMVFNTQTVNDVSPGYYYWYVDKWYKLATTAGEIITTLIDNENGTYLYTSEDGTQTLIDIPTSVVNDIINQGNVYTEIINLIDTNETVTIIEDHGNGTYTYYNEDEVDANGDIIGTGVTIDVVGDVVTNIQNQGDIYNEIINILEAESDELVDLGNGKYKHIAADGTEVEFDVNSVNVEKVIDADGNISYIFKDGDNNEITTIEVTNDVLENIVNQGDIYNEIINILEAESDELVDLGNGKDKHIAADGSEVEFDVNSVNVEKVTDADGNISYIFKDGDNNEITTIEVTNDVLSNIVNEGDIYDEIINLIDLNETITTIVDNGDGTITYTNEAGAIVIIDLAAGPKGEDGLSAYEIWEQLPGNDGKSEQDFIDSLKGEDGQDGQDGLDGKSITDVEIVN